MMTIHNAHKPIPEGYTPIYVGHRTTYRPEFGADFSGLGNLFVIGRTGPRKEVIGLYEQWLQARLKTDVPQTRLIQALVDRVQTGEKLLLICWCAPLPCPADVIKAEVERLVGRPL
ncbi:DUF4326 domain-containing protein [Deinococcus oregonensis]|uniref:DUF4326 domain-containing protein n=1 Tax=Deinococcus oregonensis TaxID=1805970 RepID=A0ABV6B055_9DEIO